MAELNSLLAELQSLPDQITAALREAEARGAAAARAEAEARHQEVLGAIGEALDAIRAALPPAQQARVRED